MSNNSIIEMLSLVTLAGVQLPHEEIVEQLAFEEVLTASEVDEVCNQYAEELPF